MKIPPDRRLVVFESHLSRFFIIYHLYLLNSDATLVEVCKDSADGGPFV